MNLKRFSAVVLVLTLFVTVGLVPAAAVQPDGRALVRISGYDDGHLALLAAAGVPVYARLTGDAGPYLLAGARPPEIEELRAAGLEVILLDADVQGASYYLASVAPGQARPAWAAYGRPLLEDGGLVLMRLAPQRAGELAEAGAELQFIGLDPKPLQPAVAEATFATVIEADPRVQTMIDQVTTTTVYDYTGDLSGEWPVEIGGSPYTILTRHSNSGEPIQQATRYTGEHLEALGLAVEYHQWSGSTNPNVIAERPGNTQSGDVYVICGHLDDMPSGAVAPGADDNASGSVAVLVAADILSQYQWDCTLRFALWTGEEQGLLGSKAYAQRAYNNGENILGVLNLDMIGYNTPASSPEIELHANSGIAPTLDLAQLFADVVGAYNLNLNPEIIPNGTNRSDHAAFWTYGYTAILGIEDMTGDFNPRYHSTGDLLQYLDMPYYTDYVKASVGTLAHMSGCLSPIQPPVANFTYACDHLVCSFDAAASHDLDGAIAGYAWDFGDGHSGSGLAAGHTYSAAGTFQVTLTVTDNDALTGAEGQNITVTGVPASMHVGDLDGNRNANKKFWRATVAITVHDATHNPVSAASVAGLWGGGASGSASCLSDTAGQCSLTSDKVSLVQDSVTFSVDGLSHATLPYTADYNHDPDSDSDGTVITVYREGGNQPPEATFVPSCTGLDCTFDASLSSDPDGNIVDYAWDFGDGETGAGEVANHSYGSEAWYTVTLTVTDDGGATDTDTQNVPVGVSPGTLFVYDITMSGARKGANRSATAVVTIHELEGGPVAGATVSGTWSGDASGSAGGVTGGDGTVTFTSGKARQANATFTFTVDGVVKDGYEYDPALNIETSDTQVVP